MVERGRNDRHTGKSSSSISVLRAHEKNLIKMCDNFPRTVMMWRVDVNNRGVKYYQEENPCTRTSNRGLLSVISMSPKFILGDDIFYASV